MAQTILLFVPDLFFQARLETAARRMNFKVLKASGWKEAVDTVKKTPPAGTVVDLGAPAAAGVFRFLEKVKGQKALATMTTLGFLDHVRADLAAKARKAGCAAVVSKNALSMDTPGYLRRLTAAAVAAAPPPPRPPGRPPKNKPRVAPEEEEE
jgi:ActR/RegA family two-component response regulator